MPGQPGVGAPAAAGSYDEIESGRLLCGLAGRKDERVGSEHARSSDGHPVNRLALPLENRGDLFLVLIKALPVAIFGRVDLDSEDLVDSRVGVAGADARGARSARSR